MVLDIEPLVSSYLIDDIEQLESQVPLFELSISSFRPGATFTGVISTIPFMLAILL